MIKPTKPTIPVTDVMPPTISAVPRRMSKRNRFKSTPIDDAVSWPRERRFRSDDDLKRKKAPSSTNGPDIKT